VSIQDTYLEPSLEGKDVEEKDAILLILIVFHHYLFIS